MVKWFASFHRVKYGKTPHEMTHFTMQFATFYRVKRRKTQHNLTLFMAQADTNREKREHKRE